jgi:hypothetical protein
MNDGVYQITIMAFSTAEISQTNYSAVKQPRFNRGKPFVMNTHIVNMCVT